MILEIWYVPSFWLCKLSGNENRKLNQLLIPDKNDGIFLNSTYKMYKRAENIFYTRFGT